ncbi:MAG: NAD(P)H-binding protein [Bacteroidales bacterium]
MKAIVLGATGATGRDLLKLLLDDDRFDQVDIFVRRDLQIVNSKLRVHIIDFEKPEQWWDKVEGDVLFSALGTTLKVAGSKQAQRRVDLYYQLQFAKAAREAGVNCYVLVSSAYASSNSLFFYPKLKGELEDEVKALNFPKCIILNPPSLVRKGSDRKAEVIATKLLIFLSSIGLFKSVTPLETERLARVMISSSLELNNGCHSLTPIDIRDYIQG